MADEPTGARLSADAALRNRDPILAVLDRVLPAAGTVLEIASGTGEHVVHFAARLRHLAWQPSEPDPRLRESIAAWAAERRLDNVRPPLALDVTESPWPVAGVDAILCINMVHIVPWATTEALIEGAAAALPAEGLLYLYGPYRIGGRHTAPSNEAFDASLRRRNAAWGVRDLNDVARLAALHGLHLEEVVDMPANNKSVILRRGARG